VDLLQAEKVIRGKKVLIVDDEKDVLEILISLLNVCKVDAASSFEEGKKFLEKKYYDLAIFNIMGVDGYGLLDIAVKRNIPALMLTAHALSEENLLTSAKSGASYFVPKEKMKDIAIYVADVLEAKDRGKSAWIKWYDRLGGFFDRQFGGTDWKEKEKEFWEKKVMIRF